MGAPNAEVGYISATTGTEESEVHKGHVVALGGKKIPYQLRPDSPNILFPSGTHPYVPHTQPASCLLV
jgi:hypothetical protein